ncbi:MAG: YchE family NAAT transporter [Candidatus Binatia bacterium]
MQDWHEYTKLLTTLLVIVDPLAAIPLFLSLTSEQSAAERNQSAQVTASTVAVVLVVAIMVGEPLLRFLGISLASFRVGGGILLLLMAIAMLQAQHSRIQQAPEETREAEEKESVAVVPLAIPLLAGPGAISTVIIYSHRATTWFDTVLLMLASLVVAGTVWIALRLASVIGAALGKTGINIITRLMGLMLAAVAVEFIAAGASQLLPGLAAGK